MRAQALIDPYLKTVRAKEHLEVLRKEHSNFTRSKPYGLQGEEDRQNQKYRLRAEVKPPPDHLSLVVGDFLYCLRSSLDQLIWCLAKLNEPYPVHTQFPIFEARTDKSVAKFARYTKGVPREAVTIIEGFQPYHAGNAIDVRQHPLWRLNALCNIDKHRRLPVYGTVTDFVNIFPNRFRSLIEFEDAGAVVVLPLEAKDHINLQPHVAFRILFGDHAKNIEIDFAGLQRIYDFVCSHLIPKFLPFIP